MTAATVNGRPVASPATKPVDPPTSLWVAFIILVYMIIAMKRQRKNRTAVAAIAGAIRLIGAYRIELMTLTVLLAVMWATSVPPWPVSSSVWLLVIIALACPMDGRWGHVARTIYHYFERMINNAHTRRQVVRAGSDSGFPGLRVEKVSKTLPGELISVRVPRGQTVDRLESSSRAMAACLRANDVRVIHDRDDRSHAKLSIIRRDVFTNMSETPWPLMNAEEVSIRQGLPFGVDEYGRVVNIRLLSRNILLGGAPDAGKSAALRLLAAGAALDPTVKLWMMDAKPGAVEFAPWASSATELVRGRDLDHAVEVFAKLTERVEKRYQQIVARGEVFVTDDMELDVLMIDELPQFTRSFETDDKNQASAVKTIRGGIWKLIAMGRAAGMITSLSAQKPAADIVPSESRDLIDNKFALHCNTKAMSDTILGAGAGEESPANAADIPSGQPGVGYYLGDHGIQKMRTFYISPKQALEISSRAAGRQMDADLRSLS